MAKVTSVVKQKPIITIQFSEEEIALLIELVGARAIRDSASTIPTKTTAMKLHDILRDIEL